MFLKKIIAQGFKSFADNTIIDLENNIAGIVGPNGSGKSNVVDAVRWVLGEQSIKSLRGDGSMTDVIFSGSKSRKPMNNASVTLIFDNSDNYLKILDELKTEIQNLKLTNKQSDELKRLVKEAEDACVNRKDSTFKKVLKQIWDFAKATGSGLLVAYLSVKFGLTN